MNFLGMPYPIVPHPRGLLHVQGGINQIKSDLLVLLLTNPGERVFLPDFGTPLKQLVFEPNDAALNIKARQMIAASIAAWEPRVTIQQITVTNNIDPSVLNPMDARTDLDYILSINIKFFDPENIKDIQDLRLEIPLGGSNGN